MHFFNLSSSCVVKIGSKEIVANLSPERQTNATVREVPTKSPRTFEDYSMEWSALWRLLIMETTSIQSATNPSNHRDHPLKTARQFVGPWTSQPRNDPASVAVPHRCAARILQPDTMCLVGNQPRNLLGKPYSTTFSKTSGAKQLLAVGSTKRW